MHPQRCNHCDHKLPGGAELDIAVVAYVKVIGPNTLLVTDNYLGQTIKNIQANGKVCLACFDKDWHGVKIFGTAKHFASGKWLDKVRKIPENKDEPAKGAVLITVGECIKM